MAVYDWTELGTGSIQAKHITRLKASRAHHPAINSTLNSFYCDVSWQLMWLQLQKSRQTDIIVLLLVADVCWYAKFYITQRGMWVPKRSQQQLLARMVFSPAVPLGEQCDSIP